MNYDIKDKNLASQGRDKILWAKRNMLTLSSIVENLKPQKPLKNIKISACLHVTPETANLMIGLKEIGAEKIRLCAANPLSTHDDVAASLVFDFEIEVFAKKNADKETYYQHITQVLSIFPDLTMDDGCDLVTSLHTLNMQFSKNTIGGTEETTTGVIRLKQMERQRLLKYPIIAINNAKTKFLFDNRYGTGQSTVDGILRATNILLAGKNFVICGYGWCGKGLAKRASGMGACVIITEIDPIKALEAKMDGYQLMSMQEASKIGDIFVTVTGNKKVITKEHFLNMKDKVILANAGHFDVEIDKEALEKLAQRKIKTKEHITEYIINGKSIFLLSEGRVVNLAAAEGHPACVMDLSFSNQILSVKYLIENHKSLENKVYDVPFEIDQEVARIKLKQMGITIDELTDEQKEYLHSWHMGT